MSALQYLKDHLQPGKVYRREELSAWSNSVDRHLKQLVESGHLDKLSGGLYHYPRQTVFGKAPAIDEELVKAFLKDDRFLLTSPNDYNTLGIGFTQLYNKTIVYNHKRHGQFSLGGRLFDFRMKPSFPESLSKEFLLVDLMNNLDQLAEEMASLREGIKKLVAQLNQKKLEQAALYYGSVKTKKVFSQWTKENSIYVF